MKTLSGICPLLAFSLIASAAEVKPKSDYKGAEALLKMVLEQTKAERPAEKPTPHKQLKDDLAAFKTNRTELSAPNAARTWLAFADRWAQLPLPTYKPGEVPVRLQPSDLVEALPAPEAWPDLVRLIEQRPERKGPRARVESALRLLAHTLINDRTAQSNDVSQLFASLKQSPQAMSMSYVLEQLNEVLVELSDDPAAPLKNLDRRLARAPQQRSRDAIQVPDLVSMVGADQAASFFRRAMRTPNVELNLGEGDATRKLAQRIALELINDLKAPQWQLAASLDGVELFEAMDKRFKTKNNTNTEPAALLEDSLSSEMDYNRKSAEAYYLLGLITRGRDKEAAELAIKSATQQDFYIDPRTFVQLDRAGHTKALNRFFADLLSKHPELPLWETYFLLAAKAGDTEKMLSIARSAAADESISRSKRAALHDQLFMALLAADRVDEGVAELRQRLTAPAAPRSRVRFSRSTTPRQLAIQLIRLGQLLEKPEWVDEGVAALKKTEDDAPDEEYFDEENSRSAVEILVDLGRGSEAETMLARQLTQTVRRREAQGQNRWRGFDSRSGEQSLLEALCYLYEQAGRTNDILWLLDNCPYWGVKDVANLLKNPSVGFAHLAPHSSRGSLGRAIASALIAANRKTEAHRIVDAMLDQDGGNDSAYELLLELAGDRAVGRLDELFARDGFEERPLIWKAHLLRNSGQLEEAEKLARQAISIDPSDGEQGPGTRMRAYSELAEIRQARGDLKEADFFRGAVRAIRLSERADRFYEAGLLTRAIKMYEEALTHFADAYCIQSRLALRMAQLGLHDAAEAHYQRAYELMPDSFGRVESHCFGCEGVFDGKDPQTVAEKVFKQLEKKNPYKPQVQYLLGYLREQQGDFEQAVTYFQQAVRLDPDYLNAWVKLQEAGTHRHLSSEERDRAAFNIIRLDPLGRHASPDFARVADLAGLWRALATAEGLRPSSPETIYPLRASALALEQRKKAPTEMPESDYEYGVSYERSQALTPGKAIAQNRMIQAALQLIDRSNGTFEDE